MQLQRGAAGLAAILILALLISGGYVAYRADGVYQALGNGRAALVAAQNEIAAGERNGDSVQLQAAMSDLRQAERDFLDARQTAGHDPALSALRQLPGSGDQLAATLHLASIGADLSRAGEAADTIALQVAVLKRRYGGRSLTPDDLQAVLQQAQTIAARYQGSIREIGRQLQAARAERAQVTTTNLLPPLHQAYDQVDAALATADTAFIRYQDVSRVLQDLLGISLSG